MDVWIRLINKSQEGSNSLGLRHICSWQLGCKGKGAHESINVILTAGGGDENRCRMPGPGGAKYGSARPHVVAQHSGGCV